MGFYKPFNYIRMYILSYYKRNSLTNKQNNTYEKRTNKETLYFIIRRFQHTYIHMIKIVGDDEIINLRMYWYVL